MNTASKFYKIPEPKRTAVPDRREAWKDESEEFDESAARKMQEEVIEQIWKREED